MIELQDVFELELEVSSKGERKKIYLVSKLWYQEVRFRSESILQVLQKLVSNPIKFEFSYYFETMKSHDPWLACDVYAKSISEMDGQHKTLKILLILMLWGGMLVALVVHDREEMLLENYK